MVYETLALDFGIIGLGFTVFYWASGNGNDAFSKMQYQKIAKWMFLITAFVATFTAYLALGSPPWLMYVWIGQIGLMLITLWIDVLTPLLAALLKFLGKR